ncbi:DUF192 domain-containing protein [Candidatus Woesearchaeota archaeon]|nr:DUF192 domain-containing protein [Candidatus Woesearchaeota archaeon]
MAKMCSSPISNKTKKVRLSSRYRLCSSVWSKARGLMFRKPAVLDGGGMIFLFDSRAIRSIHMLFVFYPIDLLFLDENKKVVEIKQGLRPFRLYSPKSEAQYVVELKDGAVRKTGTAVGDRIEW